VREKLTFLSSQLTFLSSKLTFLADGPVLSDPNCLHTPARTAMRLGGGTEQLLRDEFESHDTAGAGALAQPEVRNIRLYTLF
jgi:hypothetical protein